MLEFGSSHDDASTDRTAELPHPAESLSFVPESGTNDKDTGRIRLKVSSDPVMALPLGTNKFL